MGSDEVEMGCLPSFENVAVMGSGSKVVTGLWEAVELGFRCSRACGRRSLGNGWTDWEREVVKGTTGLELGRRVWFWRGRGKDRGAFTEPLPVSQRFLKTQDPAVLLVGFWLL